MWGAIGWIVAAGVLVCLTIMCLLGRFILIRSSRTVVRTSADTHDSESAGVGSVRPTTGLTGAQAAEIMDLLTRVLDAEGLDHRAKERIRYSVAHGTRAIILRPSVTGGAEPPAPHSVQQSDNCRSECSDPTHHPESSVRTATTTYTGSNGEPRTVVVLHAGTWVKLVYERQNDAEIAFCNAVNSSPDSLDLSPT